MEGCGVFSSRGTCEAAASPDWYPLPVPPAMFLFNPTPTPEMLTQIVITNLQSPDRPG